MSPLILAIEQEQPEIVQHLLSCEKLEIHPKITKRDFFYC